MKFMGAIFTLAALLIGSQAQAQTLTYSISPQTIKGYGKVSLNTTFELNLKENEAGLISTADVNPGLGFSAAAGLELLPEVDAELELSSYTGSVDYRAVAGVPVLSVPADEIRLLSAFGNLFYKFQPASNAQFKLGGGLGYSQYILTDTNSARHRGQGLVYQIKAVGEYDLAPTVGFLFEGGYLGTSNIDVDLSASTVSRVSALRGLTFGTGLKSRF